MSDVFSEVEKAFLRDLTEVTRRHRIAVGGCGCCGSPHLIEISAEDAAQGTYGHSEHSHSDFEFITSTESGTGGEP